jgi:TonB family protein
VRLAKTLFCPSCFLVALFLPQGLAILLAVQSPDRVPSSQAKKHVGKVATICGKVVTYGCEKDGTTYLDLDQPYWHKGVAVEIASEVRRRIGRPPEDAYGQRQVCATGVVRKRSGRYFVVVNEASDIRTEDGAAQPFVPPGAARPCDAGVQLPFVIKIEQPIYSRAAAQAWAEGKILLEMLVGVDGGVESPRVVYSDFDPALGLEQQALEAAQASRFRAGTVDGKPAPIVITLEYTFRMRR